MKLLIEKVEEVRYVTEQLSEEAASKGASPKMYIEGVYLVSDRNNPNKNNRVYDEPIMRNAVAVYMEERVNCGRAFGELGHPSTPTINHERVSHRVISLRQEGKVWIGKSIICNTPMGNIARGLIESGGSLGVSSRGLGSVKQENGITYVQEDFRLCTAADIVDDPSAPGAFVNSIMENANWYYDVFSGDWKRQQIVENTQNQMKKLSLQQISDHKQKLYEQFINQLLIK